MNSRIDPVTLRKYLLTAVLCLLAGLVAASWLMRRQQRAVLQAVLQSNLTQEPPVAEIPAPLRPVRSAGADVPRMAEMAEVVGIGAQLKVDAGQLRVMGVVPDSPAARAGIAEGAVVRAVNGVEVTGLPLRQCVDLIRGPVGSKVRLELTTPSGEATNAVELIRAKLRFQ